MDVPFQSVLCPTDLTSVGNLAIPVAYRLTADGGVVHLLHVDVPPKTGNPLYPDERPRGAPTPEEVAAFRERTKSQLSALVPKDATARRVRTNADQVWHEDVALAIEAEAKARRADVVVLASYGAWGLTRLARGESIALRLLHRADQAVIVVHTDRPPP